MPCRRIILASILGLCLSGAPVSAGWIEDKVPEEKPVPPRHVVVFIPGYEACALVDPADGTRAERVVWGGNEPVTDFAALHIKNHLEPRAQLSLAGRDLGAGLVYALTHAQAGIPAFQPLSEDHNFFVFAYDWRQGIRETLAPQLEAYLAAIRQDKAARMAVPEKSIRFVLVAHGAGGLIARTLVSTNPRLADSIERLYLVATPNLGTAHALKAMLAGTGRVGSDGQAGWGGLTGQLGEADARVNGTRVVAMGMPALFHLLPMRNPDWVRDTTQEREPTVRVAGQDMLTIGTWADFWPSGHEESMFMIQHRLIGHLDRPDEGQPERWMHHQDLEMNRLQVLLAATREWRLALGTLNYTARLLQRAGEPSRLKLVAARGIKTPTGVVSEGVRQNVKAKFMYGVFADGDGIVTLTSAVEDLRDPSQIIVLEKTRHDAALSHPRFLATLLKDLVKLQQLESAPRQEVALSAR